MSTSDDGYEDPVANIPGASAPPQSPPSQNPPEGAGGTGGVAEPTDLHSATDVENGEPIPDPVEEGVIYDYDLVDGEVEEYKSGAMAFVFHFEVVDGPSKTEEVLSKHWLPNLKKDSKAKASGKNKRFHRSLLQMGMDVRGRKSQLPERQGMAMSLVEGAALLVAAVKRARLGDGRPGVVFTGSARLNGDFPPEAQGLKVKKPKGWTVPQ